MPEGELTREDLRRLSMELDSTGQVSLPQSKSETQEQEVDDLDQAGEDSSPSQEELEEKFKRERKEKDKSTTDEDEDEDDSEEDEEEEESSESSVAEKKKAKEKERQDRSWKKLEEEKRALREEREKFEAERGGATIKRIKTVDDVREAKDGNGFSVADYEYAAKKYEEEGETEKAETLKKSAQQLFIKTFSEEWTRNTNEMIDEHPELSDARKPLTISVNKCLESLPFLKMIPDGIRYAVRISLGDSSAALLSELKTENRKLKKQLEKLNRRTRLVGSGPSRNGEPTFEGQDVLSLPKERRKAYLRELAAQADNFDTH
jgi:hypothetical protein